MKGKRPSAPTTAMRSHALRVPFSLAFGIAACASFAPAQLATTPHWSTYFGGSGRDIGQAICRGPGNLITVVGTTMSTGLATTGAYQTGYGGNADCFVARFDPSQPPGSQLLWCTYFGGSDLDMVFDAEVDAAGGVVFCGLTHSPGLSLNGPGDGFVARLNNTGTLLTNLVRIGGVGYDRITDIARLPNGTFGVVGVTEPLGLQPASLPGALNAYNGGVTDGFVGCVDLTTNSVLWTRHLGGPTFDGYEMSSYLAQGGFASNWPGLLKRQAITSLPGGRIGLVTIVNQTAATLAGVHPAVYQSVIQGSAADIYYVELSAAGLLEHATFLGGSSTEIPMDLAPHPAGGVVITGSTSSWNLPTTTGAFQTTFAGNPEDGFVLHFDPSLATGQVRYGSFVGGNGGIDMFTRLVVEPNGLVTLAGLGSGGGTVKFPTTRGSLLPAASPNDWCGAIVRLHLDNQGVGDLVYGTLLGQVNTVMHGIALDEYGDAFVIGGTVDPTYPTVGAWQPMSGGNVDACITHLPLLPGGTVRQEKSLATPTCAAPLYSAALGAPWTGSPGLPGNQAFELSASNAPPSGVGVLAFALTPIPSGGQFENIQVLVNPITLHTIVADASGFATFPLGIPAGVLPGFQFFTQWAFLTTPTCPGSGPFGATERLQVTTL